MFHLFTNPSQYHSFQSAEPKGGAGGSKRISSSSRNRRHTEIQMEVKDTEIELLKRQLKLRARQAEIGSQFKIDGDRKKRDESLQHLMSDCKNDCDWIDEEVESLAKKAEENKQPTKWHERYDDGQYHFFITSNQTLWNELIDFVRTTLEDTEESAYDIEKRIYKAAKHDEQRGVGYTAGGLNKREHIKPLLAFLDAKIDLPGSGTDSRERLWWIAKDLQDQFDQMFWEFIRSRSGDTRSKLAKQIQKQLGDRAMRAMNQLQEKEVRDRLDILRGSITKKKKKGPCLYCGGKATEVDHYASAIQKGSEGPLIGMYLETPYNLVPSCKYCHRAGKDDAKYRVRCDEDVDDISYRIDILGWWDCAVYEHKITVHGDQDQIRRRLAAFAACHDAEAPKMSSEECINWSEEINEVLNNSYDFMIDALVERIGNL